MMAVWAEEKTSSVCTRAADGHTGMSKVRDRGGRFFFQGPRLRFRLAGNHVFSGRMPVGYTAFTSM